MQSPARQNGPKRRRGSFRRRSDYLVTALIAIAALVISVTLWSRSDIQNTSLVTWSGQTPLLTTPSSVPTTLTEIWQAPSSATASPVVAGSTVVTADSGAVIGRDPLTGTQHWRYARDLGLCTASAAWGDVLAVYHKSSGCSEVTALNATTGARGPQRNGDAQLGTRLLSDGTWVTTTGATLLDTWRSDLVQTMEFGMVPDFVNPGVQPDQTRQTSGNGSATPCVYGSVAVTSGEVGVMEHCPYDPGERLTVYRTTNTNADQPVVVFSTVVGDYGARLVALNNLYAAVALPSPTRLAVLNSQTGAQVNQYPLNLPNSDLIGDPAGHVVPTATGDDALLWFTGSSTISLDNTDFHPQWTAQGTLGAGTSFGGMYLLPTPDALQVVNPATGSTVNTIKVNRHGYTGPIQLATLGPMVLEQRGTTLVALR